MKRNSVVSRALLAGLLLSLAPTREVRAGCDNIPSEIDQFRAAQGTITAPYAIPGQSLQIRVRPELCDGGSLGLGAAPACIADSAVRVTAIFGGAGAPVHAVVLARSCGSASDASSLQHAVDVWSAALAPAGSATCQSVAEGSLDVDPVDLGPVSECRLGFRFPVATTPQLSAPLTLAGPTRIVVEPVASPLPTSFASTRCADAPLAGHTIACIDELYRLDGSCSTQAPSRNPRFASFTALPVPNDFAAMKSTAAPHPALRFALDAGGNLLAPMDWSGVLCQNDPSCAFQGFPPPQLVSVEFPQSLGSGLNAQGAPAAAGAPIRVPSRDFVSSLTLSGTELPPIFDPFASNASQGPLAFFGSTDAVQTVIRLQSGAPGRCSGDGTPCVTDSGCGGNGAQTCDLSAADATLTDLRYCRHPGTCQVPGTVVSPPTPSGGPALVPANLYAASTGGFVPLDALNLCRGPGDVGCLVRDEPLAQIDENADGDESDPAVVSLRVRSTGETLPIGLDGQAEGLAAALLHEPPAAYGPFGAPILEPPVSASTRPIVEASGDCAAMLFAEPWENAGGSPGVDANGDGLAFESILRVFCRDGASPTGVREVAVDAAASAGLGSLLAASPRPLILPSGRTRSPNQGGTEPFVLAGDRLYFLLDEAANATKTLNERIDVGANGAPGLASADSPALSQDGKVVCFASESNLVGGAAAPHTGPDVYCRDTRSGQTDVIDRFSSQAQCGGPIIRSNGAAFAPAVGSDGRRVCYESAAWNLAPGGDANAVSDVFVFDRATCQTLRVSTTATGAEVPAASNECALFGDGTAVAFSSAAALVAGDTDGGRPDVYLRRLTGGEVGGTPLVAGAPILVSAGLTGDAGHASFSATSARIAFETTTPAGPRVHVRDLRGDLPVDALGFEIAGRDPRLSPNGRFLTVSAPDADEVFVIDLAASAAHHAVVAAPAALTSTLEDVGASSSEGDPSSFAVSFTSAAVLLPDDPTPNGADVHLRDLTTGLLARVGDGATGGVLAPDGSGVAYVGPTPSGTGIFRSGIAPKDNLDLDGNGANRDLVLAVLDLAAQPPVLDVVGAAKQVAVGEDLAAFLAPDGRVLVRRCSPATSCAVVPLLAPGGASPVLATDVAASDEIVCALRASDAHVVCAPAGETQVRDLGVAGRALGVVGRSVVFVTLDVPTRLRSFVLDGAGFTSVFTGPPGVRRFVLSDNGFAAYDRCEIDLNQDLNGDGIEDECVLDLVDVESGLRTETGATAIPCTLEACDRRFPWRVFASGEQGESATVRFLSVECQEDGNCAACGAGCAPNGRRCDLNLNGSCADVVVREITSDQREVVLTALGPVTDGDPLAGAESGGLDNQGAVFPTLVGRCDDGNPATPPSTLSCQKDADCAPSGVCGGPFSALALNDADGDGIFDGFDNCRDAFNPGQEDADGDFTGDACEPVCGNGVLDSAEFCDDGSRNGACAGLSLASCVALGSARSFCDATCAPQVFVDVTDQTVTAGRPGSVPARIFGTPLLNFGPAALPFDGVRCAIVGGCPAKMIDLATVRLEGIRRGAVCSGGGAPLLSPALVDGNADGIPDLDVKFEIPKAKIERGDDEACTTGAFRTIPSRFRDARFEARDRLNVN